MTTPRHPSPALRAALKAYGVAYGRAERLAHPRWSNERDVAEQALLAVIEDEREGGSATVEPDDTAPRLYIPRDLLGGAGGS